MQGLKCSQIWFSIVVLASFIFVRIAIHKGLFITPIEAIALELISTNDPL